MVDDGGSPYRSSVEVEQGSEEDLLVGPHTGEPGLWRSSVSFLSPVDLIELYVLG
jgi:hypothetical protein